LTDERIGGPVRTCVGCGDRDGRRIMMRLRADGTGELCIAPGSNIVGRTAYVHAREECVRALTRSKRLFRSLRTQVESPARERFVSLALDVLSRAGTSARASTIG